MKPYCFIEPEVSKEKLLEATPKKGETFTCILQNVPIIQFIYFLFDSGNE